jgi:DNA-binding MarR family transcriptional regulator
MEFIRFYQFRDRDRAVKQGLTVAQCHVLDSLLEHGPLSLNALSARLHLDKSTTSRIVGAMQQRGLAKRARHPQDARAVVITPTREGRRRYERVVDDIVAQDCELLTAYSAATRHRLVFLMRSLTRLAVERDAAANDDSGGGGTHSLQGV